MPTASVNGAELYYEDHGTGDPILLVHGSGANTRIWGDVPQRLADSHRVIAYDRRGFDRSEGPLARDMDQHADDAAALLRQLDAAPATVVGWSAGGVVAIVLASERPECVSSLVLAEPALRLIRNTSLAALAMLARFQLARLRRDHRAAARILERWALRYVSGGTAWDRFPADWQESMLSTPAAVVREGDQLSRLYPSRRTVAAVSSPVTCIVGGLADPAFHRATRYFRRIVPQADLVEIEGASHAIHFDRPAEFVSAVQRAIAGASTIAGSETLSPAG